MSGIIPTGRQYLNEAISGLGKSADLENQQEIANEQLKAAANAQNNNMLGSALGLGAALGPKIVPGVASALGINSALTGTATTAVAPLISEGGFMMGVPGGMTAATELAGTGAAAGAGAAAAGAGAAGGASAMAPFAAAMGPIGLGVLAAGGLTLLLSNLF